MTTFSRTLASSLLLVATAALLAGCGGSGDDSGGDGGATSGGSAKSDDAGDGKSIFAGSCGGCHTLADAGTTGGVGPNLDETQPDVERVKSMIDSGGGAMPPGLLEGEERDAVAEYVAGAAGK